MRVSSDLIALISRLSSHNKQEMLMKINGNSARGIHALVCLTALTGLLLSGREARAHRESIEQVKQPPVMLKDVQAEACPGIPAAAVLDDPDALGGKAVQADARGPVFRLDCGQLKRGVYVLYVIAKVKDPQAYAGNHLRRLYFAAKILRPDGSADTQICRAGFMKEYQDVGRLYFHADADGAYRAEVAVVAPSDVTALVDRIQLRDALDGSDLFGERLFKAIKSKQTCYTAEEIAQKRAALKNPPGPIRKEPLAGPAREKLDDVIWNNVVPMNANYEGDQLYVNISQGSSTDKELQDAIAAIIPGAAKKLGRDIGKWELENSNTYDQPFAMVNKALNLRYTMADYQANKPLPEPWPLPEDKGATFIEKEKWGTTRSFNYGQVPVWMQGRYHVIERALGDPSADSFAGGNLAARYLLLNDTEAAADGALLLAAFAYNYPGYDFRAHCLDNVYKTGRRFEPDNIDGRGTCYMGWGTLKVAGMLRAYDALYPYMKGNQELARRVGRFIPWVKTPEDVIALLDTYLVECAAVDAARFKLYSYIMPWVSLVLGPGPQAHQVMERYCSRMLGRGDTITSFTDDIVNSYSSDGLNYIGSVYYTQGETASEMSEIVRVMATYSRQGGDKKFDVSDAARFPRLGALPESILGLYVAGGLASSVGDVADIDRPPRWTHPPADMQPLFLEAWRRTGEARYAAVLVAEAGRGMATDAEWDKIVKAAGEAPRDPRLDQASRVLSGFGLTCLEEGTQSKNMADKAALTMRTGVASGHAQPDTLNIELNAYGVRFLSDLGGRPDGRYGKPLCSSSYTHNGVEVDEKSMCGGPMNSTGNAWIEAFSPLLGAQVACGAAAFESHPQVDAYRRNVILVDAGSPAGSTGTAWYVFDVLRVNGGKTHTWCFHGVHPDEFLANTDLSEARSVTAKRYLAAHLEGSAREGVAPQALTASWRLRRVEEEALLGKTSVKLFNTEANALGKLYDPQSPRKYTRVTLHGHAGAKVMVGNWYARGLQGGKAATDRIFNWPFLYVREEQSSTLWPAIIEPSLGESVVSAQRPLKILEGPAKDTPPWQCPVAIEVKTKSGHQDILYSGFNDMPVKIEGGIAASGLAAFLGADASGLRSAHLVGGTVLSNAQDGIAVAGPGVFKGKVLSADYNRMELTLEGPFPAEALERAILTFGNDAHRANGRVVSAVKDGANVRVRLARSPVMFQAGVGRVAPDGAYLEPDITPTLFDYHPQYYNGMTVVNEAGQVLGKARVARGERYMYFGFPEWQRHIKALDAKAITDANGDGRTELVLVARDKALKRNPDDTITEYAPGQEMLRLEVNRISPDGLFLYYKQHPFDFLDALKAPHAGWPYFRQTLRTEDGKREWVSGFPGDNYQMQVVGRKLTLEDFPDTDGNGRRQVQLCDFGPQDTVELPAMVAVRRVQDGVYEAQANVKATVVIAGKPHAVAASSRIQQIKSK